MIQLADLFSVPEMYLMSTVTEFFNRNHIDYHPEILFRDVKVGWASDLEEVVFVGNMQKFFKSNTSLVVYCEAIFSNGSWQERNNGEIATEPSLNTYLIYY